MLEDQHTSLHHAANKSPRNDNKAVANTTSEAFSRWLHYQYALIKLPLVGRKGGLAQTTQHDIKLNI